MTRPSSASPTATPWARPVAITSLRVERPWSSPIGESTASSSSKPITSAATRRPLTGSRR
ncbi:hypothetical protein [Salinicola tamaricis]|uniref:hypothetical protein n=1 Tax=Salinicola tamaricis TaxID=1771309 RepID=UPI001F5C4FD2|nr:hypothetical protein [Salinicola tamaricis]